MICWKCKKEIGELSVSRTTECPECKADLHVCKACKFFSPGSHYDCKETVEDPISEKERANFCDWFKYGVISGADSSNDKAAAARNAFDALFG
ncbi:MAG: hypothetical protein MJ182_10590 [Treponema sp.]|nr:hypothetical protein [Treponema sp.]